MMAHKLIWLLLVGLTFSGQTCNGDSNSSKDDGRYEGLQAQLDHLKNSQNILLERQNTLMEQLLGGIRTIANNTLELPQIKDLLRQALGKQSPPVEQPSNVDATMDDNSSENEPYIRSCSNQPSGIYQFKCKTCQSPATVQCDTDREGRAWMVIQRRSDGSENFTRSWQEYRDGFGTVDKSSEFWLGLELIHQITNSGGDYELLIEMINEYGKYGYARYSNFKIAGEDEKYRLAKLGSFEGTVAEQLSEDLGAQFSTYDQDNDESSTLHCSRDRLSGGGWWHKKCAYTSLNGPFEQNEHGKGIFWLDFSKAAKSSLMVIGQK